MRDELLAGALFAAVALVAVLGLHRVTLIVAVTIPLAMLGTFVAMRAPRLRREPDDARAP